MILTFNNAILENYSCAVDIAIGVEHHDWRKKLMKPHESPRIKQKSIRGDLGDSWPVLNRGIRNSSWDTLNRLDTVTSLHVLRCVITYLEIVQER